MSTRAANPFTEKRKRRHLATVVIATVALAVIAVTVFFVLRSQRSGILLLEEPGTVTIKINGRDVIGQEHSEGIYLPLYAGRYRIQVEKEGYQPFVQDVETQPGTLVRIQPAYALIPWTEESPWAGGIEFVRPSRDERSVYFLGDYRQRLFRLEVANQTVIPLTDNPLSRVIDVQWGENPDVALIVQTSGTYLHEIPLFDFQNQIFDQVAGPEVISPVWDPKNSGRLAAAYFPATGEQSLIVADKRFNNIQRLVFLDGRVPHPKVQWSADGRFLLVLGRSDNPGLQNIWLYTMENGDFRQLTSNGSVADARITPDGKGVLYAAVDRSGTRTRHYLNLENNSVTNVEGDGQLERTAWRDASAFYEPAPDGSGVLVRNVSDGAIRSKIAVSLPQNEAIRTVLAYHSPPRIILATDTAVYTVNAEE